MPSTTADFGASNVDKNLKIACLVINGILNMLSGGSLVLTKCANGWKSCWVRSLFFHGGVTSMY